MKTSKLVIEEADLLRREMLNTIRVFPQPALWRRDRKWLRCSILRRQGKWFQIKLAWEHGGTYHVVTSRYLCLAEPTA